MWKTLTAASTALALIGLPALAQMTDWDSNADTSIDETEFGTGFGQGAVFGGWDTDGDGMLSQEEYDAGFAAGGHEQGSFGDFSSWDEDQDSMLSEDEFSRGVYGSYDTDGDGMLSQEEFGAYEEDEWF